MCKYRWYRRSDEMPQSQVLGMCHREKLHQIGFLHGRKDRITEREYWVQCKGQAKQNKEVASSPTRNAGISSTRKAKQNKEVASSPTVGQSAKPLWSLKRICFEKSDCKYLKIAYNHLGFHNNPKLNESKEKMTMSTTARMVMKIIGASLAFAAFVCLLIGGWHDIGAGYTCVKNRMNKRFRSEYDDYDEEDSIGTPST